MARGNVLPESMKILIAQVYLEHPDWRTRKIREEVIRRWHQASLNYDDPNWPGLSAVQKLLAEYRKKHEEQAFELKELDRPWGILDTAKYPIPPEILPTVLEAWGMKLEEDNPITIREALWIARLYYVFKEARLDIMKMLPLQMVYPEESDYLKEYYKGDSKALLIYILTSFATAYARHELALSLSGKHFDKTEDMWETWWRDGWLHWILTGETDVSQKCRKETKERFPDGIPIEYLNKAYKSTYRYKEAQNEGAHNQEE
jgi:hypothetical protein